MPDEENVPSRDNPRDKDNFSWDYANNVRFESSSWDIKLIFGQLDQWRNQPEIDFHTAITIPWAMAKVLSYFLQINIALYEEVNGRIQMPKGVIPPAPEPPVGELAASEESERMYRFASDLHKKIFG